MPTIRAAELGPPPAWALLQRQLIGTMEEAADYFVEKYCRSDLSTYYVQDVDDIYEIMHNWGLFYALGGADRILDYALGFWNATTRYYEDTGEDGGALRHHFYMPQLHNEFWNLNIHTIPTGSTSARGRSPSTTSAWRIRPWRRTSAGRRGSPVCTWARTPTPPTTTLTTASSGRRITAARGRSDTPGADPVLHSLGKTTDDIEFVKAWLDHPSYGGFMHRSIVRDWERWSKGDGRPVGVDTHHLLYPAIRTWNRSGGSIPDADKKSSRYSTRRPSTAMFPKPWRHSDGDERLPVHGR